jgi:hypothetical protein
MKQEPLKAPTSAELIDELGDLQAEIARLKKVQARAGVIREQILGWMARAKPAAEGTFDGNRWLVVVTACQKARTIKDLGKVLDRLGRKTFLGLCSFPLSAVDENVPLPEHAKYIEESLTGPRQLKVMARGRAPDKNK